MEIVHFIWSEGETWHQVFMHVSEERREAYKEAEKAHRADQAKVKKIQIEKLGY